MKPFILSAFLCLSLTSFTSNPIKQVAYRLKAETYVYICDSDTAKKYHLKKDCRGLNACTHRIIKVSLEEAAKKGKKNLCGWED